MGNRLPSRQCDLVIFAVKTQLSEHLGRITVEGCASFERSTIRLVRPLQMVSRETGEDGRLFGVWWEAELRRGRRSWEPVSMV